MNELLMDENSWIKKHILEENDHIHRNLLVPSGCPIERQRSRLIVSIYRAEGLPRMTSGIVANFRKALTGESVELLDSFVRVSFAGHSVSGGGGRGGKKQ